MAARLSMHDVMSRIMHDSDSGSDFEVSDTVSLFLCFIVVT